MAAGAFATAAALLTGCAADLGSGSKELASPSPHPRPVTTFTSLGDSLSSGRPGVLVPRAQMDDSFWQAATDASGVRFVGGWAVAGTTVADIAAATPRVPADVVVVLAGTNDVLRDIPRDFTSYEAAVSASGAFRAMILAIPPIRGREAQAADWNSWLATESAAAGMYFFDPWVPLRAADGMSWADGVSPDGIHQDWGQSETIGTAIGGELLTLDLSAPIGLSGR